MRRQLTLMSSLLLAPAAAVLANGLDAGQVLNQVGTTLGGQSATSIEFAGAGSSYALGQQGTVNAAWPRFNDQSHVRTVSFDPWASRLQRVRTQGENPPSGGGGQPIIGEQKQDQVTAPGTPNAAALPTELAATLPQAFVRAASQAKDLSATQEGKRVVLEFTAPNNAKVRGWVNDKHQIERVTAAVAHPVLGDAVYDTTFTDYRSFDGVQFPAHILQKQGGFPVLDLTVNSVKLNVPVEFPAAAPASTPKLASEKLGEGIYLITGGYAAVAVEFKDHITVIEAGQNDERSNAVISEVKRLLPGKPIGELVNTHAHFDHAGGVRAYVAEGATIVTHRNNPQYYEKLWANSYTLSPDRLAQQPKPPRFQPVDDKLVLTDGKQTIELYRLRNFAHHDGNLVAWLPREKILVEADGFNPPPAPLTQTPEKISPFHVSLLQNIERLQLDVQRIIPIHLPADNRKVTLAELLTATGKNQVSAAR